jgi:uncharacterized protein
MQWSKYNLWWETPAGDQLLYNSLSNTFAALETGLIEELAKIRQDPDAYDFSKNPALLVQLRRAKVLVAPGEEQDLLNLIRLRRERLNHNPDIPGLILVPTLACNFRCTYCYQHHKRPVRMDDAVQAKLLEFIQRFRNPVFLHLTWYGGEPLLEFDRICRITAQIKARAIPFGASLVTNGYLLDEACICKLEDLKITHIQVTIDGPEEIHNRRRPHAIQGESYGVIMANLDRLLRRWPGRLNLQVNVDRSNLEQFVQVRRQLRQRFAGRNFGVYARAVADGPRRNPEAQYECSTAELDDFFLGLYRATADLGQELYPSSRAFGCTATRRHAFVIGPAGEVYKCCHDVGNSDMEVGSIVSEQGWNLSLISRYMVGTDVFADETCRACFFLPVCSGGCPHFRLRRQLRGEDFDTCMTLKNRFTEFLELRHLKKRRAISPEKRPARESNLSNFR